ncbi:FecR family protein [Sphingobacterium sp. JB170]|uniref:FecR family protein n=1 Tax=Sphingobacterium sp. JB170 TaxID=1434842 RepID=UPI00097EE637|nr:FecR family protein [Sphingobacterium sp. JB170]SJN19094.1 putative anti-sigma factor [Sphingobacterium sp. JB170]
MDKENPERKKPLSKLLDDYLTGTGNHRINEMIDHWLEEKDKNSKLSEEDYDTAEKEILNKLQQDMGNDDQNLAVAKVHLPRWGAYLAAASVLLIASFGLWQYVKDPTLNSQQLANQKRQASDFRTIETAVGERKKAILPDSTEIYLHGNTVLRYQEPYGNGKQRLVRLEKGEAFFVVTPNRDKPFTVQTAQGDNKVLGTSFNIQLIGKDSLYHLSVNTGSVGFTPSGDSTGLQIIDKGHELVFNMKSNESNVRNARTDAISAWKDNILRFSDENWEQIISKLEIWYGVDIHMVDMKTSPEYFTATFERPTLKGVLNGLQKINEFNYRVEGKEVFIE